MAATFHIRGDYGVKYALSYGVISPIPFSIKPLEFHDELQARRFLRSLSVGEFGLRELLLRDGSSFHDIKAFNQHQVIGALVHRLISRRLRVYLKSLIDAVSNSTKYKASSVSGDPYFFLDLKADERGLNSNHACKGCANSLHFVSEQEITKFVDNLDFSSGALKDLLANEKSTDEQADKNILVNRLWRGEIVIIRSVTVPKLRRTRPAEDEEVAEKPRPVPVAAPQKSYTPDPADEVTEKVVDVSIQAQADTMKAAAEDGTPFCEECEKARQAAAR